jgi:hypothetical protein
MSRQPVSADIELQADHDDMNAIASVTIWQHISGKVAFCGPSPSGRACSGT